MNASPYPAALATIEARLDELDRSGPMSVTHALDLAHQVASLVKQAAAPLEEQGHFEQAAELYDQAALAFQLAAGKVPGPDRERMAALEDFWSAKAEVTRYRVYTAPLVPSADEQPSAPVTGSLRPKPQPESPTPATPESKTPRVTLKKPARVQAGRWSVAPTPSPAGESKPSAFTLKKPGEVQDESWSATQSPPPTERVEREDAKPAEFSHKKPQSHQ
jgi:hypothetical protein